MVAIDLEGRVDFVKKPVLGIGFLSQLASNDPKTNRINELTTVKEMTLLNFINKPPKTLSA